MHGFACGVTPGKLACSCPPILRKSKHELAANPSLRTVGIWLAPAPYCPIAIVNQGRHPREIVTFQGTEPIVLQQIIETAAPWRRPAKARGKPMSQSSFRRDYLTKPIFRWRSALPRLSDTERGSHRGRRCLVGCRAVHRQSRLAEAFGLRRRSSPKSSNSRRPRRKSSAAGDWKINWQWCDLPPEVWDFLKSRKFFAMIFEA